MVKSKRLSKLHIDFHTIKQNLQELIFFTEIVDNLISELKILNQFSQRFAWVIRASSDIFLFILRTNLQVLFASKKLRAKEILNIPQVRTFFAKRNILQFT